MQAQTMSIADEGETITYTKEELEQKSNAELTEIAKGMSIKLTSKETKATLVAKILGGE